MKRKKNYSVKSNFGSGKDPKLLFTASLGYVFVKEPSILDQQGRASSGYLCLSGERWRGFPPRSLGRRRGGEFRHTVSFKNFIYLFIYFCRSWVFIAARGLSLVMASRGYSSLRCTGFSLWWLLLLRSSGSRCVGFSSCSTRAQ